MKLRRVIASVFIWTGLWTSVLAQDRSIELLSGPKFELSPQAIAAGIDGTLTVGFKVDRNGNVKDVDVLAGPMWPCAATPDAELKKVRDAVRENVLRSKFSPATKDGKPIDAKGTLDFAIGEAYKEALRGETTSKSRWVVDVGSLQSKAKHLPKPTYTGVSGSSTVRVLISETGEVISAGTIRGHVAVHSTSRRAACAATFPPTVVDGKPIKVTGLIHFSFEPTFMPPRPIH